MEIIVNDLGIDIAPLGILFLLIVLIILCCQKHSLSYLFFFSVFWIYIMFVVKETFFPLQINGTYVDVMRQNSFLSGVNIIPFYFGQFGLSPEIAINTAENIILTIPFGFGINFITHIKPKSMFWLSLLIGFGIESIQLIVSLLLKYTYRVIDINDVIFNATGILIGYGLFRLFAWLYLAITKKRIISIKRGRAKVMGRTIPN